MFARKWVLALLAIALPSLLAGAATTTTTFNVQIIIQAQCTISATTLDFGTAGVLNANVDSTNTITVTCTNTTPWVVSLNAGTGASGTVVLRKMTGTPPSTATVDYTIYRDAARTEIWGDGTSGTFTVTGTGTGSGQPLTGFGRVPPQATPAPDTYTDVITATVTF
jgi:spore coat protein U-like protein